MNEKEKFPKRPVISLIVVALFLLASGVVVGEEVRYLNDLIDVTIDHVEDREFIRYDYDSENWTNYDLYNNAQVWTKQHTFKEYTHFNNGIELSNRSQDNNIAFDGLADYIISHDYETGRVTYGFGIYTHENIFNSDIWINNSDIYVDNVDIDSDLILDTDSLIQVGSGTTNISYGGTGVINYEATGGISPAHQFFIKGMKLFQFAGGFSSTTYVRVNPDDNLCDFEVYSDDGTKLINTLAQTNLVRLKDKVVINATNTVSPSALTVQGGIQADDYYSSDNSRGWTGTFQTGGFPPLTVTVKNGIITDVS